MRCAFSFLTYLLGLSILFSKCHAVFKITYNPPIQDQKVKSMMDNVKSFFESVISESTDVPKANGSDLIISVEVTKCSSDSTLAHAVSTDRDKTTGRPIKGNVTICEQKVDTIKSGDDQYWVGVLKHELMHVLVMAKHLFDDISDKMKNKKPIITNHTQKWTTANGEHTHVASFFNEEMTELTKAAKEYFHCDQIDGVEIEMEGGSGTAMAHFDKRVFGPEIMVGQATGKAYFSQFSAALLKDSGWYKINDDARDSKGNPLIERLENGWFDRNLTDGEGGCIFSKKGCADYIKYQESKKKPTSPYCGPKDYIPDISHGVADMTKVVKSDRCTKDRTAYVRCNFASHTQLSKYQTEAADSNSYDAVKHFKNDKLVSMREDLMSQCVGELAITVKQEGRTGDTNCRNLDNKFKDGSTNFNMEEFGTDSYCFDHEVEDDAGSFLSMDCDTKLGGLMSKPMFSPITGAGCYKTHCSHGRLHVQPFGEPNRWLTCYAAGQALVVSRLLIKNDEKRVFARGRIICNSCQNVCGPKFQCAPDIPSIKSTDTLQGCSLGVPTATPSKVLPVTLATLMVLTVFL